MGDLERLGLLSTRLVVRIFGCNSSAEERGDYRKCWLHPPSDVKVNMCMSWMGRESLYVGVVKMVAYARIEQGYYVPQPGGDKPGSMLRSISTSRSVRKCVVTADTYLISSIWLPIGGPWLPQ